MKTFLKLTEEVRAHDNYNDWQAAASKHPKFARFDTATNTGYKEFGSKKLTIYALDHHSNPIGVYSHSFGRGNLISEGLRDSMSDRDKAFDDLGWQQRNKPETAMRDLARASGGGVYAWAVEHGGDLIHRMTEYNTASNRGFEYVKEKVDKLHRGLHRPYGFEREHLENMSSNATYSKKTHQTQHAEVDSARRIYRDEHAKLPVYNQVQYHAREFAKALGDYRWDDARTHISALKAHTDKGEAHWTNIANQYNPEFEGSHKPLDEVSHETMMQYRAAAKEDAKYRDERARVLKSDANMERAYSKTASDPEARNAYARWAEDSDALATRAEHRAKKRREGIARAARLSLARSS